MRKIVQNPVRRKGDDGPPFIEGRWPWARISGFSSGLDDKAGLIDWKSRVSCLGLATSPDLIARFATTDPSDKETLNELVERAADRARGSSGADLGTSIHAATEMVDYGQDLTGLPDDLVADAQAYRAAIDAAGLTPLAGEMFVANRRFRCAGSFDRLLVDANGGAFIGDTKTVDAEKGVDYAVKWSGLKWAVQIACYATALPFDGAFGWSSWEDEDLPVPSPDKGFVIVIPRGTGTAELVAVDLTVGLEAAELISSVKSMRKRQPASRMAVAS